MFSEHLEALKQSGEYSESTVSLAQTWLTKFQAFCDERDPMGLSPKDLEQWHKLLVWTPGPSGKLYSPNTVNQAVGAVRRFYRLSGIDSKKDPTRTLVTRGVKKTRSQSLDLAPKETRKLLSSPDLSTPGGIRDRAILGLLLETKISRPACSRIDQKHLCFDTGALLAKGRVQRIYSLGDGLLADLKRYQEEARPLLVTDDTPALFLNRNGNRYSEISINQMVRNHRRFCGV